METQINAEEKEWELICQLEKIWQASLPNLSDIELLEIFPEAREILPNKAKEWDTERKRLLEIAQKAWRRRTPKNALETRLTLQVEVIPRINDAEQHTRRLQRQIAYRTDGSNLPTSGRITDADIERARSVPIESLISSKIRRGGKTSSAQCPLHDDRSPSFVIYHETNSCWCFGCQQGGDTIALTMLLQKLSFLEAVKYLNRI